ncbi:MAG: hypothetical protein BWK75_04710 [Candidatus Altiarchaeales archaeon A3]|nr:MAG: hypothetical protein BWK75_04710 [Candidatus Altiarchaeales archaeon A3]
MSVVEFRASKIGGERIEEFEKFKDEMGLGYDFKSLEVTREKNEKFGDYLRVKFEFSVKYSHDAGNLKIEGSVAYKIEDEKNDFVEDKGEIKLSKEVYQRVSNTIIKMSLIELFNIARSLYLPVPFDLPRINFK